MKKAFSFLEIIIVILIISIISTFLIIKTSSSLDFVNKTNINADIAQIRSSISKENSKNVLLNDTSILKLDDANIEEEKSLLFSNILDKPLISTNSLKKEIGKWIKTSSNKYKIYITNEEYLEFEFTNNSFNCISSIELCKDFE
ncbi:prepilin-type N-terminal cleavage/methylation domain-containing protein [Arcobacter arenosus]|jgi:prepilin-type N-terminal cleavage/methylation domain-containing protein|uniref:Prepilin-type N-terminal cleavage/methylation domain-containing protein n=1 Tax=Arcobacter arenosus TaxID=2576037 RepID=A0A5R8Y325_9BACT|nr:prepilin-type N-terminal cleavage/methylation domain-containing protein [Arcobacter arenosus]TLP40507.1 prepilin-type N-terminal cleavage/methylation domain-containing protein [Arcobacter arenosus]